MILHNQLDAAHVRLSEHFTLGEMLRSSTLERIGLEYTVTETALSNLILLCWRVLEPARMYLNVPLTITSGYRPETLNRHPAVGGASDSQHMTGQAVDVTCAHPSDLLRAIFARGAYDQLIWYGDRVHVSFAPNPRNSLLVKLPDGSRYLPVADPDEALLVLPQKAA